MSSSLSTSNENSVESMPRGGNPYYSSQQHQHQQQYHYQMNQPLNYNNNINNNSNNINLTLSNANHLNYSAPNNNYNNTLNNFQQQQIFNQQSQHQQHHHNPSSLSSSSSHQHYQHPSIAAVFPSIYAESMMSTKNGDTSGDGSKAVAASNSSLMSGTGSVSAGSGGSHVQSGSHYSTVQKQIQQDWSNREYIEVIISNIKKLTDFLNSFELSCKSKLAMLDEKLTKLERQIDFVEAKVTKGETLN